MPNERTLVLETQGRQDCYELPPECGEVLMVRYRECRDEVLFTLLEAPASKAWLHVYALDKIPESPQEVRNLLERAYKRISYSPVWMRCEDNLYIYPSPVNDGAYLVLTIDERTNQV